MGNRYLESRFMPLIDKIEQGEKLSAVLTEARIFPRLIIEMVRTGEETGELDTTLEKVADRYDSEAEASVTRLVLVLPVILIGLLAIVVGYFVITFYQSYYGGLLDGTSF